MNDRPKISFVKETGIYIDDLEAAEKFYHDLLGLDILTKKEGRHIFFTVGDTILLVFNKAATLSDNFLPPHGAEGIVHFALEIEPDDADRWRRYLEDNDIKILKEASFGDGVSLYFHDPGGNLVELITRGSWD